MPAVLKYIIMIILILGVAFFARMFLLFFLPVLFLLLIISLLHRKFACKGSQRSGKIFDIPGNKRYQYSSKRGDQKYTTVIDADNMDNEYKIPKI